MSYKTAYLHLFNKFTDISELIKQAQAQAEEIVISAPDARVTLLGGEGPDDEGGE